MLPNDYNDDLLQDFTVEIQPTRTYRLNFSGGRSSGMLTGLEAMKQAILLILHTERYKYEMYSWNYGTELSSLIGESFSPHLQVRIQSVIEKALLADDRILSVGDFQFSKEGKEAYLVRFSAETTQGNVESEFTWEGGQLS